MTTERKQLILVWFGLLRPRDVDGIWGKQSAAATRKLQKALGIQQDGVFGTTTAGEVWNAVFEGRELKFDEKEEKLTTGTFWDEIEFFAPEEFRCRCGGKYCDGYPHEIQPLLVKICDRARRWSGHPVEVVSGLRCETHNRSCGGVHNSQHMFGEAADVYFYGVSHGAALAWLRSQPDVRYAYRIEGCNNIHFDIQPVGR